MTRQNEDGPCLAVPWLSGGDFIPMLFPLRTRPSADYHSGGLRFGAVREGRTHAACDLIAPVGSDILAVNDGIVITGPYSFYHGTFAIEVRHTSGIVVRYTEIKGVAPGIAVGSQVTRGQVIAFVGKMHTDSMLHFEMYAGTESGPLTVRSNPPFQRRSDLLDPTDYLDHAVLITPP